MEGKELKALWKPDGVPFCWQPKEALRRIEQDLELGDAASAKLVYLALSRIASDEGTSSFTKPINYVATLASLHRRTVERRLPQLEQIGLVTVKRGLMRTPHGYTLATLSRNDTPPSRNDATVRDPHAVALSRELENKRPRTVPERIAREHSIKTLKSRLEELKAETDEQWQRDASPHLVTEKRELSDRIKALEDSLL